MTKTSSEKTRRNEKMKYTIIANNEIQEIETNDIIKAIENCEKTTTVFVCESKPIIHIKEIKAYTYNNQNWVKRELTNDETKKIIKNEQNFIKLMNQNLGILDLGEPKFSYIMTATTIISLSLTIINIYSIIQILQSGRLLFALFLGLITTIFIMDVTIRIKWLINRIIKGQIITIFPTP